MRHVAAIVAIQSAVSADLRSGTVIEVDAYCRTFGAQYPELSRQRIQDAVLEILSIHGGAAIWGADTPAQSR